MPIQRFLSALLLAASCTFAQQPPSKAAPAGVYRMKLVRIMDAQGFGEPVEVARLLVPIDWREEGGVTWDSSQTGCASNIVKLQYRAVAPDGVTGIEFLPSYAWQSTSDPMMMQMLRQQAASRTGCSVGPVTGAAGFLTGMVIPRMRPNARVVGTEPLPALSRAKEAQLGQVYAPLIRAGYMRGFKADSGSAHISYASNGRSVDEWLSSTVVTVARATADTAALTQGRMNNSATQFSMQAEAVFCARAPEGAFDKKLVATIIASTRANPQYQAAIGQFLNNMNNIALKGAMDRAAIWRDAAASIANTRREMYQHQQAVQDQSAQQFSQTIRGVETYINPATGTNVELVSGYNNAWVNNRGEYLLSETPGFDPQVALRESWTELKKAR